MTPLNQVARRPGSTTCGVPLTLSPVPRSPLIGPATSSGASVQGSRLKPSAILQIRLRAPPDWWQGSLTVGRPSRRGFGQSFPKFLTSQGQGQPSRNRDTADGHTLEALLGGQGQSSPPAWTSLESSHPQYGSSALPGAGWLLSTSRHPFPQPPLEKKAGCLSGSCSRHHTTLGPMRSELAR